MFAKRPPPKAFELVDVPVAAGVVLPIALAFPTPGNKLPPLPPVVVEPPVPEAKGLAPEAAGFGKPNVGPEIDEKKVQKLTIFNIIRLVRTSSIAPRICTGGVSKQTLSSCRPG